MLLLGVRPVGLAGAFSPLGRETFLTRVEWVDCWPVPAPPTLAPGPRVEESFDLTDPDALADPGWLAVRRTPAEVGEATGDGLVITGDGTTLDDPRPWFVGRRQRHLDATVSATVDASLGTGGLACRYGEDHWFALEVGDGTVTARARLAGIDREWTAPLPGGPVVLRFELARPGSDFNDWHRS